jgi:MFS family permease
VSETAAQLVGLPVRANSARPVLWTLLGATVLGTVSNNILNVPLREITGDFGVSVSAGVLVVSSFVLTLAAGLALSGWIGDRYGRSRTLVAALILMSAAMVGAAVAPTLAVLVACRAVQGLACAAIPPAVMGLLSGTFPAERRAHAMGAWAAANGVGQAIGPPVGGLVAGTLGWRAIFWLLAPIALATAGLAMRALPDDPRSVVSLHWPGAASLTGGAALVMASATTAPQDAVPHWLTVVFAVVGLSLLGVFARVCSTALHPFVPLHVVLESRFMRSVVAAFSQMLSLTVVLIAIPLYMTGSLHRSTSVTGVSVFALPATMALLATPVAALCHHWRPRIVLRVGLLTLGVFDVAFGAVMAADTTSLAVVVGLLVLTGIGVALVQTPSATGATQSPAGRLGPALGLFNMTRFAGSAIGAAWVAVVYPHGMPLLLFSGAAAVVVLGFAASFAGPDPVPAASASEVVSA